MELEAPMMVDALPGRQSHSGSRLATETGFGVQHCGCLFFFVWSKHTFGKTQDFLLQVSQAEEVAV